MTHSMVITARFPLGTYLGHRPDGSPSPFPDTARLYSAMLHAAGKGCTAVEDGLQLRPSEPAVAAMRWLEEHPPATVSMPASVAVNAALAGRGALAWRHEGVIEQPKSPGWRRALKSQSDGVAFSGAIGWGWNTLVPDDVRATLDLVCADVSCLGEADSPVVLELTEPASWVPTHVLDDVDTAFPAPGGLVVRTPVSGRFDELEQEHRRAHPPSAPTTAADRHSWSAIPRSEPIPSTHVRERIYRPVEPPASSPWPHVLTVPVKGDIDTTYAVQWCVALHKALASRLPTDAPPVITGRYSSTPPPPNRVAIQLVPGGPMRSDASTGATFAVLLPAGMDAEELAVLQRALKDLRSVYCRAGRILLGRPTLTGADAFWRPVPEGMIRRWRPTPALVPEVRRQAGAGWGLEDAVGLSLAHVLRANLAPLTEGASYRRLASLAKDHGMRGFKLRVVRTNDASTYVHKVPRDLVVQPVTGFVDIAELIPSTAIFALGQSRHLGGGLMIPVDLDPDAAAELGLDR